MLTVVIPSVPIKPIMLKDFMLTVSAQHNKRCIKLKVGHFALSNWAILLALGYCLCKDDHRVKFLRQKNTI
jgi:hypothetical protein